jgi:hypothetical protein
MGDGRLHIHLWLLGRCDSYGSHRAEVRNQEKEGQNLCGLITFLQLPLGTRSTLLLLDPRGEDEINEVRLCFTAYWCVQS